VISTTVLFHATAIINSLAHIFGKKLMTPAMKAETILAGADHPRRRLA
jgi:fatty-acid desaturase